MGTRSNEKEISNRRGVRRQSARYAIHSKMPCIVKNKNSRCSSFWLDVDNISMDGIRLRYNGMGCLPFEEGALLTVTLDLSCVVFNRPIHLLVEVRHVLTLDKENSVCLGTKIIEIDELHREIWESGIEDISKASQTSYEVA